MNKHWEKLVEFVKAEPKWGAAGLAAALVGWGLFLLTYAFK